MVLFSKYLDQIKAEDDLKKRTKAFVKVALNNEPENKADQYAFNPFKKENFASRRLITAAFAVAAFAMVTVSSYAYYMHPFNYISLDINPSVELGVNAFNVVVSIEGINGDGKSLIKDNTFKHISVKESIGSLVKQAIKQEFVAKDGSTVIAVTSESNDEKIALLLQEKSEEGIRLALSIMNRKAIIYTDVTTLEVRKNAIEMCISVGKYKMIENLKALDPSITFDEYKYADIRDIIAKSNDLLSNESIYTNNQNNNQNQNIFENGLSPGTFMVNGLDRNRTQLEAKDLGEEDGPSMSTGLGVMNEVNGEGSGNDQDISEDNNADQSYLKPDSTKSSGGNPQKDGKTD